MEPKARSAPLYFRRVTAGGERSAELSSPPLRRPTSANPRTQARSDLAVVMARNAQSSTPGASAPVAPAARKRKVAGGGHGEPNHAYIGSWVAVLTDYDSHDCV